MAQISPEISRDVVAFANQRIQELLKSHDTKPVESSTKNTNTEELINDIYTGVNDDEENLLDDDEEEFNSVLDNGTEEEVEDAVSKKAHQVFKETPKGYQNSNPLTSEQFNTLLQEILQNRSNAERALNNAGFQTGFASQQHMTNAANRPPRKSEPIYGHAVYDICGSSKKCTEVAFNLDLQKYSKHYSQGDIEGNLKLLTDIITFEVIKNFPKIHSIAVCDNYLIINETSFVPNIENTDAKFPMDSIVYIKNGCIAPFVDWKRLFRHSKTTCGVLSFDSSEFYLTYVGDSLGLGRRIGISTAFSYLPYLDKFYIEGEDVNKKDLNTPKSAPAKRRLATKKRNFKLFDGYQFNVCNGTQSFQNFGINSLKNYANNRGNKGFIRYAFGTVARFGLATVGTTLNLGTHLISGIAKGIKTIVHDSMTPVEDSDIYN